MDTEKKVFQFIRETEMIKEGDTVIAGVSGGADSVYLLYALHDLERFISFSVRAVHVNHSIRGIEADEDEQFVVDLCKRLGVPLCCVKRNIPKEAEDGRLTEEEAGRKARYDIFYEAAAGVPSAKIALAHHENDVAETMLLNLSRGSGIRGLTSLRPVRGTVIRPLLVLTGDEIRESLRKRGIAWREDSTNAEDEAARNRIRHHVIPCLETDINPKAVSHMAGASRKLLHVVEFLEEYRDRRISLYVKFSSGEDGGRPDSAVISPRLPACEAEIICEEIVLETIRFLAGTVKDIESGHVDSILKLFDMCPGKGVDLPYGLRAWREPDCVVLGKAGSAVKKKEAGKPVLHEIGTFPFELKTEKFVVSAQKKPYMGEAIPQKRYTKWLDYDKIKNTLKIRTRAQGDFLTINAAGGKQTISDFFTNHKVPSEERDEILLLADGREIVWIVGDRIGYRYRVTDETRNVLIISAELLDGHI